MSSDSSSPPPNPLYTIVKDLEVKVQEGKSLRELTAELCTKLSTTQLGMVNQYTLDNQLSQVEQFFSGQASEVVCTIASSHVFVRRDAICVPAEIGLVKVSFRDGITGWYDSLFDSRKEKIQMRDGPFIDKSIDVHGIAMEAAGEVDLVNVLHEIHHLLHPVNGQREHIGWVFIYDDEFIQTRDVLLWCQARSDKLKLELVWNVRCLPLSSVCKFSVNRFSIHQSDDIVRAMFGLTPEKNPESLYFCLFHASTRNVHCAHLRAHHYAQMLLKMFESRFKQMSQSLTNRFN